jgi:inhibitor of KinA sporulation pathway (predicted exonuclease)
MNTVMVDLETLSTESNAAIVAIGAVLIDLERGSFVDKFYRVVDPESAIAAGGHVSGSTLKWWLKQSDEARHAIAEHGIPLKQALEVFSSWVPNKAEVWGNGATFDNVVLTNAYNAVGLTRPWSYRNDRCYRTLKSLYPHVPVTYVGTAHNALNDAESQGMHLINIWQYMNSKVAA